MTKIIPTIATHNGAHHADDIFGVGVLLQLNPAANLVRTRDPAIISAADFAVDVGGVWDPESGRFDHHQKGFEGKRESGVVYASAGLVWAAHGLELVKRFAPAGLTESQLLQVHVGVDEELVQHLDRADTGAAQGAPGFFGLSALLSSFNPTRTECNEALAAGTQKDVDALRLKRFMQAVEHLTTLLNRVIQEVASAVQDADIVRAARTVEDGQILVLPEPGLVWDSVVVPEMPKVLFVLYPDSTDNQYQVRTVPVALQSFTARKDLPQAWAGLRDQDLAKVTGAADAVFCHNGRFIAGAGSLEGALTLARQALAAP